MTRQEAISLIAENITVSRTGYGTWEIKSTVTLPANEGDDKVVTLRKTTHNEEDYTGIYDPEEYNPYCGFTNGGELQKAAWDNNSTTEEYCNRVYADTTNEDNYEPRESRNRRLAIELYDELVDSDLYFELDVA